MFDFKRLPVPILRDLFGASVPAVWYRVCAAVVECDNGVKGGNGEALSSQLKHGATCNTRFWGRHRDWHLNGHIHRDNDLPAIDDPDEGYMWYKNGRLHRDNDLPAAEDRDGYKAWYRYGRVHRDGDLPAREYGNGTREWWKDGKRHRDNGRPAVVTHANDEWWYENDVLIRWQWV